MTTLAPPASVSDSPSICGPEAIGKPLIELTGVGRDFPSGESIVSVLRDINLTICAGEMVAIVGASGSGKSTLMNILGCLDRPSHGTYRIDGEATQSLDPDALARLRREHFGFIFQRYNLLGDLSAIANVEVPAVYAGRAPAERHERGAALLGRLGMGERLHYRPSQLSGGQQQRVSIARALMNDGPVLFADEPTGALDSLSGTEVMATLRRLHEDGRTIILVTHDMHVAENADRIIEIADGRIVSDRVIRERTLATDLSKVERPVETVTVTARLPLSIDSLREALRMALLAMNANRLRTALTMLGIVIGIASVVTVVAIGQGSQRKVLEQMKGLGTSTIEIWSGSGWGDTDANKREALQPSDSDALAAQYYIAGASPTIEHSLKGRVDNVVANVNLIGVSERYFNVKGLMVEPGGRPFGGDAIVRRAQEVVIDQSTVRTFFRRGQDAVGQTMLLGNLPVRVVGIAADSPTIERSQNPTIFIPYTTLQSRIVGRVPIRSLVVRVKDGISAGAAEQAVTHFLSLRRGTEDFYIMNSDAIRRTTEATARTMSLLISAVAVISLMVGGIGVMNIMLVSVTERTGEIGIRAAVGARRSDILSQFLIEAVLICLIGGTLGVAIALAIGFGFGRAGSEFEMVFSPASIVLAVLFSTLVGVVFGWLPARNASRLDPVRALARE